MPELWPLCHRGYVDRLRLKRIVAVLTVQNDILKEFKQRKW